MNIYHHQQLGLAWASTPSPPTPAYEYSSSVAAGLGLASTLAPPTPADEYSSSAAAGLGLGLHTGPAHSS